MIPRFFLLLMLLLGFAAHAAPDPAVVRQLAAEESDDKIAAIHKLALTAEPEALAVLQQLADGTLKDAKGEDITINNRVRRELEGALAVLKLIDPDATVRFKAVKEIASNVDAAMAPMLARARDRETDANIRALLVEAHALATLKDADPQIRIAAAKSLATSADPNTKAVLKAQSEPANEAETEVRRAAFQSYLAVEDRLTLAETIGRIFSGLSLGSILLLAALGLAITYGVMGVINMAHGELLMIGAYATYAMQGLFRSQFPAHEDWYLLAAVPVAFFAAAVVGILLERTVIRWLYGRALETLLATWGLSLMLIQAARVIFGAQNVEVANPSWMSGGLEILPSIVLPLNRIVIVGFALFVLALVWVLMNRTRLGMFVRAVTQNRAMAGCVGVPTGRIDTVAFALGAGIAGLGGVALSQIANVGPDMGQGYIVDSFMVVVLGGVGQLAGAVWAALGLGIVTKFIESWAGAVIAKIVVLVFIIMFIQKRPQGLFALKGRFVES
ncbi:MAG: urea ABC transporter permease subunit UrtB [Rhodocyclales bacterium RIFCSPLOWO2_02_FULL_63_24]|nr:MAG: urea ABC transporter permease subunit UrtB [Rhodocyclales bacterium GWA2_65_19]OHC68457.1 MAG: urea ABC transporter permease subunit UrtB [Rhodocyclales bacterium RIFCSPLOWO2_02_FULL_63_24]